MDGRPNPTRVPQPDKGAARRKIGPSKHERNAERAGGYGRTGHRALKQTMRTGVYKYRVATRGSERGW